MSDKTYTSTESTQYYYVDTDTGREIPIIRFHPSSVPSYYDAYSPIKGDKICLHYTRIKVKNLCEKEKDL
jgi:hypothetical protein